MLTPRDANHDESLVPLGILLLFLTNAFTFFFLLIHLTSAFSVSKSQVIASVKA